MTKPCLLIGDIGGTNARFALAKPDGAGFFSELTLSCDDYETAEQISPEFCNSVANLIQEAARS